ncbi:nuclear transport factor 2 family protein [Sporichthya brevicatena]|uniref:Nuclear transport factor 2 family protein n=1 Tax=Sporichthya brevicatena TaxID=171442 RepID=A0ABN1GTB0_9ACTN
MTVDAVTHGTVPIPDQGEWLADYVAIRELSARYNRAVDDCRFADFAQCFTEDGVFEVVGLATFRGRAEIEKNVSKFGFGTMHLTTDPTVEISGDSAVQICSVLVGNRQQNRSRFRFLTTGRYHDDLVRTPDGWRFTHRRVDTDLDITIMAATIAGKNVVTRHALAHGARAFLTAKRLVGRGWAPRHTP